jgi:hypothetical protein
VVDAVADGSASSSVTTLDQNVMLVEEEGATDDDWQSNQLHRLSVDTTTEKRLATMARKRRPRPRRWPDGDDGMCGGVLRRCGNNDTAGISYHTWMIARCDDDGCRTNTSEETLVFDCWQS